MGGERWTTDLNMRSQTVLRDGFLLLSADNSNSASPQQHRRRMRSEGTMSLPAVAHKREPHIAARNRKPLTPCRPSVLLWCLKIGGGLAYEMAVGSWRNGGERAQGMNWSTADLFGPVEVPERPSSRFDRLSV